MADSPNAPTGERNRALGQLLKLHVSPCLRRNGFKRFGHRFVAWYGRNCELVKILTDTRNEVGSLPFTLYLGAFSRRLWYFETEHAPVPEAPDQPDCQWGDLLERFVPRYRDRWFEIADETQVPELGREITPLLDTEVLPVLSSVRTDEGLRDYWATGQAPGAGHIQRLAYLAYLCHEIGPREDARRFVDELSADAGGTPAGRRYLTMLAAILQS